MQSAIGSPLMIYNSVCVCLYLVCVSDGEESAGPDVSGEGAVVVSGDAGPGRAGAQRAGESGLTGPGQSSARSAHVDR